MHQLRSTVRSRIAARGDEGATTAEYAVCTGAGVGFAGLLYQFITSGAGESLLGFVFDAVRGLVGF